MIYDPDQSNNVYMTECEKAEGLGQNFEYDPSTYQVKQDGLCLLAITSGGSGSSSNALMSACEASKDGQKWSIDIARNQVKLKESDKD